MTTRTLISRLPSAVMLPALLGMSYATADSAGNVGRHTSITIGSDGMPAISYLDFTNADLKVTKCGNAGCDLGNALTTVDSAGDVGSFTSITIGTDGLPVISYYGNTDLKVAKCGNASCSSGNTITTVDSDWDTGWFSSITIGTDGYPVISYDQNSTIDLKVAKCANQFCINNWNVRISFTVFFLPFTLIRGVSPRYFQDPGDDICH